MIHFVFGAPDASALADLRQSVGWNRMARDLRDPRLSAMRHLCAYDGETLVGYAAAVTNGVTDAYIQDVTVRPAYQHRGIGTQLMHRMLAHLQAEDIYMVSVIYGEDALRPFYERFGFHHALRTAGTASRTGLTSMADDASQERSQTALLLWI